MYKNQAKLYMMDEQVKQFIEKNINLIEQQRWEEIYNEVSHEYIGRFTQIMLEAGIDPAEVLGYIPKKYLKFSAIKEYIIPDNVAYIGEDAFCLCKSLTSVVISDSVTSIGSDVFYGCYSLTSVTIGNSVISIGDSAFRGCKSLTSIVIPNSVESIGNHAFSGCTFTSITYLGTKEEAMRLEIENRSSIKWRYNSNIEKIICTDGIIEL